MQYFCEQPGPMQMRSQLRIRHSESALHATPPSVAPGVADVSEQTAGGVKLWPAMLYGSLDRMTRNGWIAPLEGGERPEGESERKRYYRITELGAAELERETERVHRLAKLARSRSAALSRAR